MDSLTFHRRMKSMLSTPRHPSFHFSELINWAQPNTHPHFDECVYKVHCNKEQEEARKSIIEHTYHRTINCALHWASNMLTPHCLSKCSQHCTSMFTCHRISKAHSEASLNVKMTTVASTSSPHSSYCPTISHWWVYKWWHYVHCMHPG